jgi:predicted dinucleotide-binding enzyme
MNIGIIGTGNMGRTLGLLWAELGHQVLFGARTPDSARAALAIGDRLGATARARMSAGTNDEAAAFGELVYYSPRDVAPAAVLSSASLLDGKIVVDSTNGPVPPGFDFAPIARSRSELLQGELPRARVVKAWNTMAQEVFELCPDHIRAAGVSVYVASDFEDARAAVMELTRTMGFEPVDCGPLRSARMLEGLGDFIRTVIINRREVYATISVHVLERPARPPRFGERTPTRLA